MSFLKIFANYPINIIRRATLSTSSVFHQAAEGEKENKKVEKVKEEVVGVEIKQERNRRKHIDVETSIRYMNSPAFKKTYGDELIWIPYRRNHKGNLPGDTRRTCVRKGWLQTGNACPVCRDKYLVVHYNNLKLLEQFISPYDGQLYPTKKTGVCQNKQRKLQIAIMQAKDRGLLVHDVPHRHYDYSVYMPKDFKQNQEEKS